MARFTKKIHNPYYRYLSLFLVLSLGTIALTIAFNVNYTFSIEKKSTTVLSDAIAWQAQSRGVIATQVKQSGTLKDAQVAYAMSTRDIDTLVLGSSSVMSIREDMFPANRAIFNGAKNSNPLHRTLAEARYYINQSKALKWIIIGFDWELGSPFRRTAITAFKPDLNVQETVEDHDINIWRKIKDAVTYQRVKIILANIKSDLFNPEGSYECPKENNLGIDIFNPPFPRTCYGFRHDGSATFSNFIGLTESRYHSLLKDLQKYKRHLVNSQGKINEKYLDGLVKIDRTLKNRGGRLIVFLPPMMPQARSTIEKSNAGIYLKKAVTDLSIFAEKNSLSIFDASQSEQFDCEYGEFLDPHHAFDSCYAKIFNVLYK